MDKEMFESFVSELTDEVYSKNEDDTSRIFIPKDKRYREIMVQVDNKKDHFVVYATPIIDRKHYWSFWKHIHEVCKNLFGDKVLLITGYGVAVRHNKIKIYFKVLKWHDLLITNPYTVLEK